MKHLCLQAAFVTAALLGGCATARAAVPPPAESQPTKTVTLNFVNADIEGVVKAMAEITGKNFVIDPRVKGTVNIISSQPVARSAVYDVFLSALRLQGFTAVEDHDLVKILPEADAKLHRNVAASQREGSDGVQTRVFTLTHQLRTIRSARCRTVTRWSSPITPATCNGWRASLPRSTSRTMPVRP